MEAKKPARKKAAKGKSWVDSLEQPKGRGVPRKPNNPEPRELSEQMKTFVQELLVDFNQKEAAIRAGYSQKTAQEQSARLMSYPIIQRAVKEAIAARGERTKIDQDRIIKRLWGVAFADANALVQYRRTCCRHCYGEFHRYQRTAGEMESDEIEHRAFLIKAQKEGIKLEDKDKVFDTKGGIGYDPRKDPHPDCPECFGEGVGRVHITDTRKLEGGNRDIYAGVKQTKDGLQILMHDPRAHVELLMKHAGMLDARLIHAGDKQNPLIALIQQLQGSALPTAGPEHQEDEDDED